MIWSYSKRYFHIIYLFSNLADAFIQSNLQMRTIEAIKPTKEQQHAYDMYCHMLLQVLVSLTQYT